MFCPKCGDEYREGFYRCAGCNVNLVNELPKPKMREDVSLEDSRTGTSDETGGLKTIATYLNEADVYLALSILEANNIKAAIFRDDCGGMRPYMSFGTGIKLVVHEKDVSLAVKLLANKGDGNKGDNHF